MRILRVDNKEATIVINGKELLALESMTIRVALESFSSHLEHDGLGDDEHANVMFKSYMKCIDKIRQKIFRTN